MEENASASALVVLTVSESKRLLARAVASLPEVRRALQKGRLIIGNGTTNAFVAQEILGREVPAVRYAAGIIYDGRLAVVPGEQRLAPYCLENGALVDRPWMDFLQEFGGGDVFIKGANAVDPSGAAGVLVQERSGGTIGRALPVVTARGGHLIMPVGLEKLVPSVVAASRACRPDTCFAAMGSKAALIPVVNAQVITEVEAIQILCGVEAVHVSSGGVDGSEGSVVLALSGERRAVSDAYALLEGLKGEPQTRR